MRAIKIDSSVQGGRLVADDIRTPSPGPNDVLIQVHAAGVNRPDVLQRQGLYNPPQGASPLPGLEVSGVVRQIGENVSPTYLDQSVCALVPGGGYADAVTCPAAHTMPLPSGLSMIEAAAVPETALTVWCNVFERAPFKPGTTVLVHGGNSGIGSMAIQMIKAMGGTVIATARGLEKVSFCKDLGADHVIDSTDQIFAPQVKELTHGAGANIILDMIGGDTVPENLKALAVDGTLSQIAFLTGSKVSIDLMPLMLKRQTLTGSTLRAQSDTQKALYCRALEDHIWPHITSGLIRPQVTHVLDLSDAQTAHDIMESGTLRGKIVLTCQT